MFFNSLVRLQSVFNLELRANIINNHILLFCLTKFSLNSRLSKLQIRFLHPDHNHDDSGLPAQSSHYQLWTRQTGGEFDGFACADAADPFYDASKPHCKEKEKRTDCLSG